MMQYLKKAKERTAEDHRKLRQTVSEIIENVCESGDRALHEYSRRFDASDRASFRVSRDEIEAAYAKMTEQELAEKREIATNFGETLSWEYLCYVRQHPIIWNVPTCILYGEHDNLTSIETVSAFAKRYHAKLTVMPGGEHWFHTEEQMQFLDHWVRERGLKEVCG